MPDSSALATNEAEPCQQRRAGHCECSWSDLSQMSAQRVSFKERWAAMVRRDGSSLTPATPERVGSRFRPEDLAWRCVQKAC